MKLGQNVCFDEISDKLKMGHNMLKTWSLSQILEKPCVGFRGYFFSLIIMKPGQNVCLDHVSDKLEIGSGWV